MDTYLAIDLVWFAMHAHIDAWMQMVSLSHAYDPWAVDVDHIDCPHRPDSGIHAQRKDVAGAWALRAETLTNQWHVGST
jgi:hypothetical protein